MRDLTGNRYGHLIVMKYDRSKKKPNQYGKYHYWICKCDCGNIKSIMADSFKYGNAKSCGCLKGFGKQGNRWEGHQDIPGRLWGGIKRGAKQRKIPFDITIEEAWQVFIQQSKKCALTGLPLHFTPISTKPSLGNVSLDRIDSSKGYSINNIQWIYKPLNRMKWELDQLEFIRLCNLVTEYQNAHST
jgi:hypothetical protein